MSPTNIYAEWVYPGGVPSTMGEWWQTLPVVSDTDRVSTLRSFQENSSYNEFWEQIAITEELAQVDVPVLHIGGYFDIFKEGGFDALRQRPDKTWLITGPWTHWDFLAVPGEDAPAAVDLSYGVILQWLDHWLLGDQRASVPPSRVISFENTSTAGEGTWGAHDTWPVAGVSTTRLFPAADGGVSATAPASGECSYSVNPYDGPSVGQTGTMPHAADQDQAANEGVDNARGNGRCRWPDGGREDGVCGRTTFTLPAFDTDTSIAGPVTLHLTASITAADTHFVSKLETVLPDGRVLPIETGYLRAQLRTSLSRPEEIEPGKPIPYTIPLGNMHWKFKAGERLRVTLSGGDFPKIKPTAPAGIVTIHHGTGTYLDVPVVGS
ncbi:CocE/NonD family hydrolase [Pseudonocardia thermophila]|uniref:CocE/NonD family hydrolase n=1 Tax=Pseudonocardia thermophila TaxID=1848 RepID=UPI00116118EE|nr:CocE/NonD family hydrolase [Pseudonocardia thermophila]